MQLLLIPSFIKLNCNETLLKIYNICTGILVRVCIFEALCRIKDNKHHPIFLCDTLTNINQLRGGQKCKRNAWSFMMLCMGSGVSLLRSFKMTRLKMAVNHVIAMEGE